VSTSSAKRSCSKRARWWRATLTRHLVEDAQVTIVGGRGDEPIPAFVEVDEDGFIRRYANQRTRAEEVQIQDWR
jgi:hypothetical protein